MKHIFLICILLLSLTGAKAQGYESIFGHTSTEWNIAEELLDVGYTTFTFSVTDTLIFNNHTYHKINKLGWGGYNGFSVREDTITGKIWLYYEPSNQERLMADMSLMVGDSLKVGSFGLWDNLGEYAQVDSVYFKNNRKHIRFNRWITWQQTKKLELIEGVGPNAGILYLATDLNPNYFYSNVSQLVCAHKDGNLTFADSALFDPQPCLYNPVGFEEDLKKAEIKVYPNPSSDLVTFALDNYLNERVTISLTDKLGRTVQEVTSTQTNPLVSTAGLHLGIYFYRISVNGKPLSSGKISVSK